MRFVVHLRHGEMRSDASALRLFDDVAREEDDGADYG